jgi:predicted nucleic acid-binding protein
VQGYLFDTSAWLAATFEQHSSHSIARRALQQATPTQPAASHLRRDTLQYQWVGFVHCDETSKK